MIQIKTKILLYRFLVGIHKKHVFKNMKTGTTKIVTEKITVLKVKLNRDELFR